MTSPEARFERELEVFRTEAEAAMQFFYAYLTVHAVAKDHKPVYRLLNTAPLFWNTNLGALQTSAFIALGRVFDQSSSVTIASINMSLGGGQSFSNCDGDSRKLAIDNLASVGIATVIASGNNGFRDSLSYPAFLGLWS